MERLYSQLRTRNPLYRRICLNKCQAFPRDSIIEIKHRIAEKRNKLRSALDEGDFSSVPTFQPFAFEPIVT